MQSINSSVLFYHLENKFKELIEDNFTYRELMKLDSKVGSLVVSKLFDNIDILFNNPSGRKLLKTFGPKSGDGPSLAQRENGFTSSQYFAKTSSGKTLKAKLSITGDPANVATSKFMIAGANCLLDLKQGGGVGSPTYFCGLGMIKYLERFDAKIEV